MERSAEEMRRRKIIQGWTFRLKGASDMRFADHCLAYIRLQRDDPPPGYTDPLQSGPDAA
jgi:hypothetical protein